MSPVIAMPAVLEKRYNSAIFLFGSLGHMRKFRSGSSKKTNMLSGLRARGLRAESASTWVLKTRLIEKIPIIFLQPNCRKLQSGSKNVFLKIRSKVPKKLGPFFHFSSLENHFPVVESGFWGHISRWKCPKQGRGKGHISKWKWPFPHSRFGHFQCPKRKYKTTSQ